MAKIHDLGNSNPTQGQPTQQIDLSTSKPIVCEECGYNTFIPATRMRRISKLVTGTPQDVVVPYDILLCGECGSTLQELLPEQIKVLEELDKQNE